MTDTDAWQKNNPRESVYSISGGTSKRTADSTDPIYQYSTVQGKTKTRKFAHPKTARAIDGPAGDDRKFSKSTSRTRVILLSACALVLLSVCVAIAVAIGGIGKRQSVQHVDGNERNLSHHQPSSNDVTSTPSLQEIHIITSERFQRQPESTPNVVTALNDRTTTLDTTPEVPPQTAKLTDSGHLHEDVVSSASPYEDGNQHVSNMVTEVASKRNSQSVENTVTVNIPLTQKPSAASRQNRLTDITTVYSGSDDIMSKPLAASQSSETASDLKLDKTLGQPNYSNLPNTEAPTPTSAEISTLPPFEPNSRSYQLDVTQAGIKKANELNNLQDTLPFYCDFQNTTLCGFTQDYLDDFDWSRNSGGTSSSNTGPSYDHTQNDLTGYYMYIETSNYNLGDTARLISPEFLIENHLCLRFWYHMYGADIGEFNVYQKRSSYLGNAIWSKGLAMGNVWLYANVTLANSGIAMAYQVVFEGVHGGSYQGDIAIDDVLIQDGSCDDIYSSAGIEPFRTNMTVDLASQVELVCKLRRSGNPHMDGISWTRISGYNVDVVAHGLNVLVSGYSVAWNASSQHYTLRIHSVRYIDDAEWRCRFDAVDLEESVWLQVRHTLPFYCDFQNTTICGFTQDSGDDFDWQRNSGETSSYDTGPSYDHTENDFTGYYMYIETSSHGLGYSARLISPAFDIENHLCLRFWYHMYGADIGELNVYQKRSSYLGNAIWSKGLDMGNVWHYANITLANSGIAMAYQVVFEGVHGGSYQGDIAIDDVLIQDGSCDDIYTSAGIEPFPTNLTVDYASQVELICRVRGVGHPQMDIVSWTRISGDTVVVAVRGLNVLDTGDDPEEPGEQNRYSVAWNASSQYYTLRIHSVRNIDEAEWLCRFDTVDLEESVWLQVRDPVCQWQCLNGGVCRHTWNGSSICFCPWPYSGDDCSIGTTGSLDVLCDFGDALICGVTYEADDYTEFVWANILNFDFSPIVDHTYGNASAYFGVVHTVYAYRYHSMTRLFTPVYTASSSSSNIVCLEFWYNTVYHLSGTHVDVFLRQSGVANDTIINSFDVDYLETGWRQSSVPITIEAQFFQMIIELSFAYREMILIDDLIVHDGTCKDIDECSAGEFYCEDNTTCVSADYACDRNMNCPDRSDERGCGDCGGEFNVPAGGSRKIQSPGSTYGLYNINCSWLITTDDDFSFKVVFDQWSDTIQYGSMDIGSGSQVSNHGRQLRFRDRILGEPEFLVNSNELWLHLRIDFLYSYNVWQIMLLSQPESPLPLPGELCTFEDVYICGFIRGNSGEMWARQRGQVSQRQPWYDHTSQNGYYMYVDGDYYYGTGVRLTSITQPPSRESCLEFWYYMSSSSDHLRVFINGGGNNDTLIVRLTGNIEPFWRYARIAYSMDEPHQVIFEGESYYWSSNIASTMFGCRTRLVMYHIVAATSPFKAIPQRFF
ncbi:MAM and LDL-receptor class A domain-containing protein 1-like isoform X1 [Ptychodera flava]|uniref:MAM and LDL-receptor class A domain-containing protein 1-like isoform X1 n=1 Tax=Ptychodera flava TaxID=63121 RepID=UPI00396A5380